MKRLPNFETFVNESISEQDLRFAQTAKRVSSMVHIPKEYFHEIEEEFVAKKRDLGAVEVYKKNSSWDGHICFQLDFPNRDIREEMENYLKGLREKIIVEHVIKSVVK